MTASDTHTSVPDKADHVIHGAGTVQATPVSSASRAPLDAFIGLLMAGLGAGNLVQGQWAETLPWLDLTGLGFAISLPLTLLALIASRRSGAGLPTLLLISIVLLGLTQGPANAVADDKRVALAYGVLFVWLAAVLLLDRSARTRWFFIGLIGLGLVVLVGQVLKPDPVLAQFGRITPEGLNPIGAGRLLGAAAVISLVAIIYRRGWQRTAAIVVSLMLTAGLLATSSRGPLLGLVVGFIFVLLATTRLSLRRRVGVIVVGAVLAVALSAAISLPARIFDSSSSGRDAIYDQAMTVILEHPFGVGWGNFYVYVDRIRAAAALGESLYAHNILLEVLAEAGLLAGILLAVFFVITARRAWRERYSALGVASIGLLASLLAGAMVSSDVIGNRLLWMVAGMITAAVCRPTPDAQVVSVRSSGSTSL